MYKNISLKLGMTPKIYRQARVVTKIVYAIAQFDLGHILIATTEKGICSLKLGNRPTDLINALKNRI